MTLSIRDQILKMKDNSAVAAPCVDAALDALEIVASTSRSTPLHSLVEVSSSCQLLGGLSATFLLHQWYFCILTSGHRTDSYDFSVCPLA